MTRRAPNMTEKLAAALVALQRALGVPIPREHVQLMTAYQICSLFEFDHYPIRHVDGGTTHPDNLEPRWLAEHGHKTATIDQPQISKRKRIVEREAARTKQVGGDPFIAEILDEVRGVYEEVVRFRRRPKATIRSRGFDETRSRTFRGKVVPKKRRRS